MKFFSLPLFGLSLTLLGGCGPRPPSSTKNTQPSSSTQSAPPSSSARAASGAAQEALAIVGGRVLLEDGSLAPRTIHIKGPSIRAIDEAPATPKETVIDVKGATLLPAFIDSHVHITFSYPEFELQGGIAAALDLGAPPNIWEEAPKMLPFRLYPVGQLITAPSGYPTQGWGADGYGREVKGVKEARAAVNEMADRGAKLIKMPLSPSGPLLSPQEQRAVVEAAHARGLPVGSHALEVDTVKMALSSGVDILVHAPTELLPDSLIESFCQRERAAVITTFYAFGASDAALTNVKKMRAAGCTVLYGTDLGNGVSTGIQPQELALYVEKLGMSPKEAIEAATRVPAEYFGLSDLGALAPEKAASLVAVQGDPYQSVTALEKLSLIVIGGQLIPPP